MFDTFLAKNRELAHADQARQRELTHAERMKALELGLPLPEVEIARAQAEAVKARTEAAKCIVAHVVRLVLPLGVFGIALGVSAVVIYRGPAELQWPALALIWICSSLVSATAVLAGWIEKQRWDWLPLPRSQAPSAAPDRDEKLASAIRE
jgi:hypothetical protein